MPPPPSHRAYGGAGPFEMGMTWALTVVATMAVCARTYVSVRMLERPGWDLFWAWVAYTMAVAYGIGNHIWLLSTEDIIQASKWDWLGRLVGIFGATFGKYVVIALLLRIQGSTHQRKSWILHFIWATNLILAIAIVTALCRKCRPVALWWDKSLPGTCDVISSNVTEVLGLFQGSWMAASDVSLAIYPITLFWNLNMSWKRKAGLFGLMGGGLIAGVCAAIKTVEVQRAYDSKDFTYNIYPLLVTSLIECWMVIILACIPPLRVLFVKAFEKTKEVLTHGSASYDGATVLQRKQDTQDTIQLNELSKAWIGRQKSGSRKMTAGDESEEEILSGDHTWSRITVTRDYQVCSEKPGDDQF